MDKILATLTNSATRWQQVTSDGIALRLRTAARLGARGVNRDGEAVEGVGMVF